MIPWVQQEVLLILRILQSIQQSIPSFHRTMSPTIVVDRGAPHYFIIVYLISKESLRHSPESSSLLSVTSEESSLLIREWAILDVSLFDVRKSDSLRIIVEEKRFLKEWRLIFDLLICMTDRVRRRGKSQYIRVRRGWGMLGREIDWVERGRACKGDKYMNKHWSGRRKEGRDTYTRTILKLDTNWMGQWTNEWQGMKTLKTIDPLLTVVLNHDDDLHWSVTPKQKHLRHPEEIKRLDKDQRSMNDYPEEPWEIDGTIQSGIHCKRDQSPTAAIVNYWLVHFSVSVSSGEKWSSLFIPIPSPTPLPSLPLVPSLLFPVSHHFFSSAFQRVGCYPKGRSLFVVEHAMEWEMTSRG